MDHNPIFVLRSICTLHSSRIGKAAKREIRDHRDYCLRQDDPFLCILAQTSAVIIPGRMYRLTLHDPHDAQYYIAE